MTLEWHGKAAEPGIGSAAFMGFWQTERIRGMKRIWIGALLAAALCLLPACGARTAEESGSPGVVTDSGIPGGGEARYTLDTLRVAYNNADSLEPYRLYSTMNQNVVSLLYDPLVKLDQEYQPHFILAWDVQIEGLSCAVTLKSGVLFSDGSPLTPEDVVYSVQQARASAGPYQGRLANVAEVSIREDGAVMFTLNTPDYLFANLLTFPIVKAENQALGCGRYVLSGTGDNISLTANPRWHGGDVGQIRTVELVNQLDKDTLIYSLKLGTINYAYTDLTGGESLALGVSTQEVPLNQLVYLGINGTRNAMALPEVRSAINMAVDRAVLANQIYGSGAVPAHTPFNPHAREIVPQGYLVTHDLKAAQELMASVGYTQRDSEGYYVTEEGRLRMRLLVNVDNSGRVQAAEAIRRSLSELGIEITVDARMYEEYKSALKKNDFELYLGTTRLLDNMDLTFLITPGGSVSDGIPNLPELQAANAQLRAGGMSTEEFTDIFYRYTPFVPLMYRSAMVAFSREAYFETLATEQDIFYNIENW